MQQRPAPVRASLWVSGGTLFWGGFALLGAAWWSLGCVVMALALTMIYMSVPSERLTRRFVRPIDCVSPSFLVWQRQQKIIGEYYVLANTYGELGERELAADFRDWADLFKLYAEAQAGRMSDRDLEPGWGQPPAVSAPEKPAQRRQEVCPDCGDEGTLSLGKWGAGYDVTPPRGHAILADDSWVCPHSNRQQTIAAFGVPSAVTGGPKVFVPHLVPNTEGGHALGTCSACGVTIYQLGMHLVKRNGKWSCPNPAKRFLRSFTS